MSSDHRFHESQASAERYGSNPSCSASHQSLLTLLPSIWCAAVAAPHKNPLGNRSTSDFNTLSTFWDHGILFPAGVDMYIPPLLSFHVAQGASTHGRFSRRGPACRTAASV